MSVMVNGHEFRTLAQPLYLADGRQVMEVYANGAKVYPEGEPKFRATLIWDGIDYYEAQAYCWDDNDYGRDQYWRNKWYVAPSAVDPDTYAIPVVALIQNVQFVVESDISLNLDFYEWIAAQRPDLGVAYSSPIEHLRQRGGLWVYGGESRVKGPVLYGSTVYPVTLDDGTQVVKRSTYYGTINLTPIGVPKPLMTLKCTVNARCVGHFNDMLYKITPVYEIDTGASYYNSIDPQNPSAHVTIDAQPNGVSVSESFTLNLVPYAYKSLGDGWFTPSLRWEPPGTEHAADDPIGSSVRVQKEFETSAFWWSHTANYQNETIYDSPTSQWSGRSSMHVELGINDIFMFNPTYSGWKVTDESMEASTRRSGPFYQTLRDPTMWLDEPYEAIVSISRHNEYSDPPQKGYVRRYLTPSSYRTVPGPQVARIEKFGE